MKTSVNAEAVSSPPARAAVWAVKIRADQGGVSEKQGFSVKKWLAKPWDGRTITKTDGKFNSTQ
jgi:hypothetical protein